MNDTLIYLLIALGIASFWAGTLWDLTRGHRNLKRAEQESRRMNHTQKSDR